MIEYAPAARRDLQDIADYLDIESPVSTDPALNAIAALLERLERREFEGPEHVLLRTRRVVRSWPLPPFRIYYQRRADVLYVLRIYHQARRPIARPR